MSFDQPIHLAVVFDFDGTLAPDSTTKFLEHIGIDGEEFWYRGVEPRVGQGWDPVPAYLYELWKRSRSEEGREPITRDVMRRFGAGMRLYEGAAAIFERLRGHLEAKHPGVELEFYLISSGVGEILRATPIADRFVRIWACEFLYDDRGRLEFPRNVVSFTDKTRYLFEISKGILGSGEENGPFAVNRKVAPDELRIPLARFVFVGDGYTDVPCFHLVRRNGGAAIGVYDETRGRTARSLGLLEDDRVSDLVPADYRPGSELYRLLVDALDTIAARRDR